MADTYTAGQITDSTKIINTQIQQKTSTGMIAIHPETSSNMVVNEASTVVPGETITDVLQNALPLKAGNNINITQESDGVKIAFTGSLAPNVSVKGTEPITVSENKTATSAEYTVGVNAASVMRSGVVKLNESINDSTTTAATPAAVKTALASKQDSFNDGSATIASVSNGIISITPAIAQNKGTISSGTGTVLQTYTKDKINSLFTGSAEYLGLGTAIDSTTGSVTGFSKEPNSIGDWGRVGGTGFEVPANLSSSSQKEIAHVGDILICVAKSTSNPINKWDVLHTEVDTNTWRPIKVGTVELTDSSTKFEIATSGSISQTFSGGKLTLTGTDTNTQYELKQPAANRDQVSLWVKGATAAQNTITITDVATAHAATVAGSTQHKITFSNGTTFNGGEEVTVDYNTVGAAASSHTHGNITNGGQLSANITIGSGDRIVITDSSNSNKIINSSISFDGSTTTKALTQKGTWESFAHTVNSGVRSDGTTAITSSLSNGTITLGNSGVAAGVYSAVQVNSKGIVSAGAQLIKVYEPNDVIGAELATNGFALIKM